MHLIGFNVYFKSFKILKEDFDSVNNTVQIMIKAILLKLKNTIAHFHTRDKEENMFGTLRIVKEHHHDTDDLWLIAVS